ncbi:MAG TPA: M13 family metallopeptidase N-terminal domain-containing protein, partial [Niabella sp.]|nr:M13 family metallopeptidase N-terminal domain-containing protein [Niabella sp.]
MYLYLVKRSLLLAVLGAATVTTSAQLGQKGFIDRANMDLSVHPGDDFSTYANGNWVRNNPIPPKETRWGSFNQLRDFNINAVKTILEKAAADKDAAAGSITRRVGDFYAAGMD